MSASLLEIVELGDGEIVLRREGVDSEPLVTIIFSEEARLYIRDNGPEIARAMIQAGIAALAEQPDEGSGPAEDAPRVLH